MAVAQEPTVKQKLMMGFATGGMVGLTIGAVFGTAAIVTRGAGPRGFIATLSQYMATSGATFAFFMSIGSVIRTEELRQPYTLSESVLLRDRMRQRWDEARRRRTLS